MLYSSDLEVFHKTSFWLQEDKPCFLFTVVKTWGSSPRPVGSIMCCDEQGHMVGSLSGGCVEDDLLERVRTGKIASGKPELVKYGLAPEDTLRLGLPCGGVLYVVVEPLLPDSKTKNLLVQLLSALEIRKCVLRKVDLSSGQFYLQKASRVLDLEYDMSSPQDAFLHHYFGPKYHLFIIGAGMVSMYLAEIALKLDYHVTVCDTREKLLEDWQVSGTRNLNMMPDEAIRQYAHDPMSAVVALTHDPRIDDMGLMEALVTDAFYVGAMGSKITSEKRRKRLRDLDINEEQLARLHAPVGLPIGSKTPPEIAISIISEITAVKKMKEVGNSYKLGLNN